MKHRLLDLIVCPGCRGGLIVKAERCEGAAPDVEIVEAELHCGACGAIYPVVESVPWLAPSLGEGATGGRRNGKARTAAFYGYGWRHSTPNETVAVGFRSHFDMVRGAVGRDFVRPPLTLDAGCGGGRDLAAMAERYPAVEFVGVDLSEGVHVARRRTSGLRNVHVVRADLEALPFRDETFSTVYSYGVIHHTPDPVAGLRELARAARPTAWIVTYLYEDFSRAPAYGRLARGEARLRNVLSRMSPRALFALSAALVPFVFAAFVIPHRLLVRVPATRALAARLPFRHAVNVRGLIGDVYDRFVPVMFRYSEPEVRALYAAAGVGHVETRPMRGWLAWGIK